MDKLKIFPPLKGEKWTCAGQRPARQADVTPTAALLLRQAQEQEGLASAAAAGLL